MIKKLSYETSSVIIGTGALSALDPFFKKKKFSQYIILCDENTSEHCLSKLILASEFLQEAHIIEVESGEENKVMETCQNLWLTLQEQGVDKRSVVINLGGGVITDLGGFAAALYKRGIPFINIPTTLLAMVDASVGGKNGIDFNGVKNLIGTIVQPELVVIDSVFLQSLPERQIKNGVAEILKIATVCDVDFLKKLQSFNTLTSFTSDAVIFHAVKLKHVVVKKDPHEKHLRKCLNFGHSIGHALESACLQYNLDVLHGEAVAAGMIMESYIAWKAKACTKNTLNLIVKLVSRHFSKIHIGTKTEALVLDLIRHDKKNQQKSIVMAIATEPGKFDLLKDISPELISEAIHFYTQSKS